MAAASAAAVAATGGDPKFFPHPSPPSTGHLADLSTESRYQKQHRNRIS